MDEENVLSPEFVTNLTSGFDERLAFNVTDGSADLGDDHIGGWILRRLKTHSTFNFVGDVRDDLNGVP